MKLERYMVIGCIAIIHLVGFLLVVKLFGSITWSWWFVLTPAVFVAFCVIVVVIGAAVLGRSMNDDDEQQ